MVFSNARFCSVFQGRYVLAMAQFDADAIVGYESIENKYEFFGNNRIAGHYYNSGNVAVVSIGTLFQRFHT